MTLVFALVCLPLAALAEDTLLARAVSLSQQMTERAGNEAWLPWMTDDATVRSTVMQWGMENRDEPRLILEAEAAMPETQALAAQLVAPLGAFTLSAASIVQTEVIFAANLEGSGFYLLLYDRAAPVLVSWYAERGAVGMCASVLPFDDLSACATAEEATAWFSAHGVSLPMKQAQETPLPAAGGAETELLIRALELTDEMNALAGDAEALAGFGASEPLRALPATWAGDQGAAPRLALQAALSEDMDEAAWLLDAMLPDGAPQGVLPRAVAAMPTALLAGLGSVETVAASSMVSRSSLFAATTERETGLILFLYEEAAPVMLAWYAQDGAVSMRGYFAPIRALSACQTAGEINELFAAIGLALPWEAVELVTEAQR